ncbi:MAG TPA: glucose-6-phosphate isomerase [Candidatus Brocadiales bacterium]|nr:glucose-6-phosphate isomerase [Candidatus Brocadiales bacterium]
MLRTDFKNMLRDSVGRHGLSPAELQRLGRRAERCLAELKEERDKGRRPFLDLPYQKETSEEIKRIGRELRSWVKDFVVLGIGGSALGNIALHQALNPPYISGHENPRIHVVDTIDPDLFDGLLKSLDLKHTVFNVISKTGTSMETVAQFLIVRERLKDSLGSVYRRHIITTTDPEDGALRRLAEREGYRQLFIPKEVGGRYSVLSPVGLLSAAVSGINIDELLAGAAEMDRLCQVGARHAVPLQENPAMLGACLQYLSYKRGRHITVIMPYSSALEAVGEWFCQLWAESLGKKSSLKGKVIHCGPTPVRAVGPTDQHSQLQLYMEGPFDKVITFVAVERFKAQVKIPQFPEADFQYLSGHTLAGLMEAERRGTELALAEAGRPSYTIYIPELSAFHVGGLLYMFQVQTALAGKLFGVDPFNQPSVAAGKAHTSALLGKDRGTLQRDPN